MKGQILTNFIANFTDFLKETEATPMRRTWQVFVDGSSYHINKGVGIYITTTFGEEYNYAVNLVFKNINNEVKYKALFAGLAMAKELGVKRLI